MTEVEHMFRVLVATITSNTPEQLNRPFEVAELYQNILPYRLFRRELGLETNQDYELTLMELLAGAGEYLQVDERMRDVLSRELASPNPDPGTFRQFAAAQVAINPDALVRVTSAAGGTAGPGVAAAAGGLPVSDRAPAVTEVAMPNAALPDDTPGAISATPVVEPGGGAGVLRRQPITPAAGESCRFCGGRLPAGRPITYCPHCGQDQTVLHCDACGTELEVGWKFCTTCGRKVASE